MKDHNIDLKERQKIAREEFDRRRTEENTKLNYFLTNKRQRYKPFKKKTTNKKHSVPEDDVQLFTNIFVMYIRKNLICAK